MKTRHLLLLFLMLVFPMELLADPCKEVWVSSSGPDLQALDRCRQLAETGDAYYQLKYGLWLFGGLPDEYQNRPEGMMWMRRSAENGNLIARVGMAKYLSTEEFGKDFIDYVEAYAWYAVLNNEKAMKNIADRKLTAAELEQAKKLANEYVEKYGQERLIEPLTNR
jgi:TPR repeat protein